MYSILLIIFPTDTRLWGEEERGGQRDFVGNGTTNPDENLKNEKNNIPVVTD